MEKRSRWYNGAIGKRKDDNEFYQLQGLKDNASSIIFVEMVNIKTGKMFYEALIFLDNYYKLIGPLNNATKVLYGKTN